MSANSITCPISSIEYYNQDTRRVVLDVPEGNDVSFNAGQYLQMVLPHKKCPFSIASSPHLKNQIELHIRPTPGSEDSIVIEELLDTAKEIEIEAPLGDCFMSSAPDNTLFCCPVRLRLSVWSSRSVLRDIDQLLQYFDQPLSVLQSNLKFFNSCFEVFDPIIL